jgi:SAM-dependent methyltransferase
MRRPHFIARQSGHPAGVLGWILARVMARETARVNGCAIDLLDPRSGDRVLDVGTGHARALGVIATRVPGLEVIGADPSPLMCAIARRHLRPAIRQGHARIIQAAGDALPMPTGHVNAILSVHTVYFWDSPASHLAEFLRVLRAGGRVVLAYRIAEDPVSCQFPAPIYRFPTGDSLERLARAAGFVGVVTTTQAATGAVRYLRAEKP